MHLSIEEKIISKALASRLNSLYQNELIESIEQKPDWERTGFLAREEKVESLLYHYFSRQLDINKFPASFINNLKKHYYDTVGRNIVLFDELKKVLKIFEKQGIKSVILKGPALISTVYKDWGLRWSGDIDLLVPDQDLFKAQNCLLNREYIQDKEMTISQKTCNHHLIAMRSNKNSIQIELHWSLFSTPIFELDMNGIWERIAPYTIENTKTHILSPEDMLLHLCLHHFFSNGQTITYKLIYDVATVIYCYKNSMDWEQFIGSCDLHQSVIPAFIQGFKLCNQLFHIAPLSTVINDLLQKYKSSQMHIFNLLNEEKSISYLFVIQGFSNKIGYLVKKLFPSIEYLSFRYSISVDSKFIYLFYIFRPILLIKSHSFTIIKLCYKFFKQKVKRLIELHQSAPGYLKKI